MTRFVRRRPLASLAIAALAVSAAPALGEGYLAGKAEALPELKLGLGDSGLKKEGGEYSIVTGKGYSLKISSTGMHECAFIAPEFFKNIYIRKVEVNKVEIKLSGLIEIEMEREGEAELYFVAIRPGTYTWSCRNLESTDLKGTFTVK